MCFLKRFKTSALVLLLSIFALSACSQNNSNKAPNVTFNTLDGQQLTMQDLQGKVVLVKFWATDCTTCIAQMPGTIKRYNDLESKGYDTVAVAMKHDPESYVRRFTETRQLPFKVVMDTDGSIAKAFGDVRMTPTTFLIDKKGRILKRYLGNYDEQAFMATVNKALAG